MKTKETVLPLHATSVIFIILAPIIMLNKLEVINRNYFIIALTLALTLYGIYKHYITASIFYYKLKEKNGGNDFFTPFHKTFRASTFKFIFCWIPTAIIMKDLSYSLSVIGYNVLTIFALRATLYYDKERNYLKSTQSKGA